jgi:hypothetical protein
MPHSIARWYADATKACALGNREVDPSRADRRYVVHAQSSIVRESRLGLSSAKTGPKERRPELRVVADRVSDETIKPTTVSLKDALALKASEPEAIDTYACGLARREVAPLAASQIDQLRVETGSVTNCRYHGQYVIRTTTK